MGIAYVVFYIAIGLIIGVIVSKMVHIRNNRLIDYIVALVALGIFGYYMYSKYTTNDEQLKETYKNYEIIISFFSSFVFSWILSKYTGDNQLKQKEKDYAIKLFRSCINLKNNMRYSVNVCSSLNESSGICHNKQGSLECQFSSNLKRVRDMLIIYERDIDDLKNDLSDTLAEDIDNYSKIEKIDTEIEKHEAKTQNEDMTETEETESKLKIDKRKKERQELLNKLDVRVKIILKQEKLQEDEMKNYLEEEKRFNQVRITGIQPAYGAFMSREEFQGTEQERSETGENIQVTEAKGISMPVGVS